MAPLLFHSTNGQSPAVNLREALLHRPGAGPRALLAGAVSALHRRTRSRRSARLPYHEIAFRVLSKFTEGIVPDDELAAMCQRRLRLPRAAGGRQLSASS